MEQSNPSFSNPSFLPALQTSQRTIEMLSAEVKFLKREQRKSLQLEHFWSLLQADISRQIQPLEVPLKNKEFSRPSTKKVLQILLSDDHADQVILPEQVNGLENYNMRVYARRLENYFNKIESYVKRHGPFDELVVQAFGDHINGEIHNLEEVSQMRNCVASSLAVGQIHAQFYADISRLADEIGAVVRVICITGNHGRRSQKKDYRNALRSFDYLVHETSYSYCKGIENIDFTIPDAHATVVNILGKFYHVDHGDEVKAWSGIPWYGVTRRNARLQRMHALQNQEIYCKINGHFHTPSMTFDQMVSIMNGSFKSVDEYMLGKGIYSPAAQVLLVSTPEGIEDMKVCHLASEDDVNGPKRYQVLLGADSLGEMF